MVDVVIIENVPYIVTLELNFNTKPENIQVEFKTEVPITQEAEVLLFRPYSYYGANSANKVVFEPINILTGILYRLEVRVQDTITTPTDAFFNYSLYETNQPTLSNLMFRDSTPSFYNSQYVSISNPTDAPSPAPLSELVPPITELETAVTLEIDFGPNTDDVSIRLETYVPLSETAEVLYFRDFMEYPSQQYGNQYYIETIPVAYDVLYVLQIRTKNEDGSSSEASEGIKEYSVYQGYGIDDNLLLYRDTFIDHYESQTIYIERPETISEPPEQNKNDDEDGSVIIIDTGGNANFCFSGNTQVRVMEEQQEQPSSVLRYMKDLRIGDRVLTQTTTTAPTKEQHHESSSLSSPPPTFAVTTTTYHYEPIYMFGHSDPHQTVQYIQLLPMKLEITPDHLVFLHDNNTKTARAVPARSLRVGDRLLSTTTTSPSSSSMLIEEIRSVTRVGAYGPFTPSGTVVVNDIVASNYVTLQQHNNKNNVDHHDRGDTLLLPSLLSMVSNNNNNDYWDTGISIHWMDHAAIFPFRLWYHYLRAPMTTTGTFIDIDQDLSKSWYYSFGVTIFRQYVPTATTTTTTTTYCLSLASTIVTTFILLPIILIFLGFFHILEQSYYHCCCSESSTAAAATLTMMMIFAAACCYYYYQQQQQQHCDEVNIQQQKNNNNNNKKVD